MIFQKSNGIMAAAMLLSLSATASLFAQQNPDTAGIVRITDGRVRSANQQAAEQGVQQISGWHHGGTMVVPNPAPYTGVPNQANYGMAGGCPNGNCPGGYGAGYGNCQSGRCGRCRGCLHGLFCERTCKRSPDYGYSPPSKIPLLRRGVEYTNYYPAQWYGAGADYSQSTAPMVYQPTDTTQLGFYYQHVPFWQPQANRLPARPIPADWHVTPPPMQASTWANGGCYSIGHGGLHGRRCRRGYDGYDMMGGCPVDGMMNTQSFPTPITTPGASGQPTAAPVETMTPSSPGGLPTEGNEPLAEPNALPPTTSLPPSPTLDGIPVSAPLPTTSATSGHIRRIGFAK